MTIHDLETKKKDVEVDWVSPPSETVLRLIYQKEINVYLFRLKIGFSVEEFINFIHDKIDVDAKLASLLSKFLGGSQVFWMNRYKQFNEQLEDVNKLILSENARFLHSLSAIRQISVDELLDDFKASTLDHLVMDYLHSPKIMYSKSQRIEPSPANIANWIRNCEIVAEKIVISQPVGIFSTTVLENNLGEVVALTKVNSVNKVISRLKSILLEAGVILILSPSETGNGVSGFTKLLLKKYRLVVVTDRYKNNAAFWFTLLHELAHCILHSINQPIVHYSDEEFILASLPTNNTYEEDEANGYVEQLLFSKDITSQMKSACKSYRGIMRLGVKYDISSALIVAQIHRGKLAPYSYYRKVYKKVRFDDIF